MEFSDIRLFSYLGPQPGIWGSIWGKKRRAMKLCNPIYGLRLIKKGSENMGQQEEYDIARETGATLVDEIRTKSAYEEYKMNDTIEDNDHLWPNFETACRAISNDLADVHLYKLFGGCPNTCTADVYLADAIMSAKRILNHLVEAQVRREVFIAVHKKSKEHRS